MTRAILLAVGLGSLLGAQSRQYNDPVARLDLKLGERTAKLEYSEDRWGYLTSLLKELDLNRDSQILVFSKTSFQQDLISPAAPRALYFNDDVVLGAVQNGAVFELASLDPTQGITFYSLGQKKAENPRFKREYGSCAFCHGPINRWAQGIMVATVFPAADGMPFFPKSNDIFKLTDHRSPFEARWGGYYVTGHHGKIKHRGNAMIADTAKPEVLDTSNAGNVTSLAGRFDVSKYLEPTSDIVALMTLEHQTMMVNMLTSLGAQFRASATFPVPQPELDREVDDLVDYMLFIGETRLESPIKGISTFSETFAKRGPRDSEGRSLRDFDLQARMFKYPLSYMIYSATFDGLPAPAREKIYRRLYDALKGGNPRYREVTAENRRAILEILIQTKKGLPDYFKL
jgi:hypothetical protein